MATTFSGSVDNYRPGSVRILRGDLSATTASGVTATAADPVVFTKTTHGLGTVGTQIRVRASGMTEMTEINNRDLLCTVTDANTLTALNEDGSGFAAETTGGVLTVYTVVDFGYSDESTNIDHTTQWRDRTGDQDGTTILDKVLIGESLTITLGLKETHPAQWNRLIGPGTLTGTSFETGGSLAGTYSAYDNAYIMWLVPMQSATTQDTDNASELVGYKMHCVDSVSTPLNHGADQVLSATFHGMPDRDRTRGSRMFRVGSAT